MQAPRRFLLNAKALRGEKYVRSLSPAVWFRKGQGIAVTGAGVSQWDDQSGNARHLKQGTDTNRPALQADGTILFDGVDNYLKCDAFTLNQPETIYILFKQVSWTNADGIFDGNTAATGLLYQNGVTPHIYGFHGTTNIDPITAFAIGTYGVIAAVFNGTSSLLQHNLTQTTEASGSGIENMGGFTLGCWGNSTNFGNFQVAEVIIFASAHDATQRANVIRYLASVGSVELDS